MLLLGKIRELKQKCALWGAQGFWRKAEKLAGFCGIYVVIG